MRILPVLISSHILFYVFHESQIDPYLHDGGGKERELEGEQTCRGFLGRPAAIFRIFHLHLGYFHGAAERWLFQEGERRALPSQGWISRRGKSLRPQDSTQTKFMDFSPPHSLAPWWKDKKSHVLTLQTLKKVKTHKVLVPDAAWDSQGSYFAVQRKIYDEISINELYNSEKHMIFSRAASFLTGSTRKIGKCGCRREQSSNSNTRELNQVPSGGGCQNKSHEANLKKQIN